MLIMPCRLSWPSKSSRYRALLPRPSRPRFIVFANSTLDFIQLWFKVRVMKNPLGRAWLSMNNPWIQLPPAIRTVRCFREYRQISFPWISLRRNIPDVMVAHGYDAGHWGLRAMFHSRPWKTQREAQKMWRAQRVNLPRLWELDYYKGCVCVPQASSLSNQDIPLHDLFFFTGFRYIHSYPIDGGLNMLLLDVKRPTAILEYDWKTE